VSRQDTMLVVYVWK